MGSQQRSFNDEVFILDKRLSLSDNFIRYFCFGKKEGPFWAMKRISSKKIGSQPDLFDRLEGTFEVSKSPDMYFLNGVEAIHKVESLVKYFDSFELASEWAKVLIKNSKHFENWFYIFGLTQICLEAYNAGKCPYTVGTKTLFLLAKHEGYPVEEDFFKNLREEDKKIFFQIIKLPASLREPNPSTIKDTYKRLYNKLKVWLQTHSEILF